MSTLQTLTNGFFFIATFLCLTSILRILISPWSIRSTSINSSKKSEPKGESTSLETKAFISSFRPVSSGTSRPRTKGSLKGWQPSSRVATKASTPRSTTKQESSVYQIPLISKADYSRLRYVMSNLFRFPT